MSSLSRGLRILSVAVALVVEVDSPRIPQSFRSTRRCYCPTGMKEAGWAIATTCYQWTCAWSGMGGEAGTTRSGPCEACRSVGASIRCPEVHGVGGTADLQFLPQCFRRCAVSLRRTACVVSPTLRAPASPPVRGLGPGCTRYIPEAAPRASLGQRADRARA